MPYEPFVFGKTFSFVDVKICDIIMEGVVELCVLVIVVVLLSIGIFPMSGDIVEFLLFDFSVVWIVVSWPTDGCSGTMTYPSGMLKVL